MYQAEILAVKVARDTGVRKRGLTRPVVEVKGQVVGLVTPIGKRKPERKDQEVRVISKRQRLFDVMR